MKQKKGARKKSQTKKKKRSHDTHVIENAEEIQIKQRKAMVQVKTKEVKMIKRLSWNENIHLFGWVQNNKEVFSADDNL